MFNKVLMMLKRKTNLSVGILLVSSIAMFVLGAETVSLTRKSFFEEKLQSQAIVGNDATNTLRFMKETFMMDPTNFLHPDSNRIRQITKGMTSHEQVYDWVKANIKYEQSKNSAPSDLVTVEERSSNCFGVAAVTTSMLRSMGVSPNDVHIAVGQLDASNIPPHAWTELRVGNEWIVIDPTDYLVKPVGRYIVSKQVYLASWPRRNILFEYNDRSFRFNLAQ